MVYITTILIVVSGLIGRRNRYVFLIVIALLWILFGFNSINPDYINYYNAYNNIFRYVGNITEPLFQELMRIANATGINYQFFLAIIAALSLILIGKTVWDFSPYPCLVMSLYFFYPFTLDVVQCRNALALSIVIFAIKYIIEYQLSHDSKNLIKYATLIIVSTGVHFSCALYLIALTIFIKNKKLRRLLLFVLSVVLIIVIANIASFSGIVGYFIGSFKASSWISNLGGMSLLRKTITAFIRIGINLICILSLKLYKDKKYPEYLLKYKESRFINTVDFNRISNGLYEIILYFSILSVFEILISSTYERLGRPTFLLSLVLLTRSISIASKSNKATDFFLLILLICAFFSYYMIFSPGDSRWFDLVFRAILENNILFP